MFFFMIILLISLLQRFLRSGRGSRERVNRKLDLGKLRQSSADDYKSHAAQKRPLAYNLRPRLDKTSLIQIPRRLKKTNFPISTLDALSAHHHPVFKDTLESFKGLCQEFYLAARSNNCNIIVSCDSDKQILPAMIRVVKEALTFYRRFGFGISRQVVVMAAPRIILSDRAARCDGITYINHDPTVIFVNSAKDCKVCIEKTVKKVSSVAISYLICVC